MTHILCNADAGPGSVHPRLETGRRTLPGPQCGFAHSTYPPDCATPDTRILSNAARGHGNVHSRLKAAHIEALLLMRRTCDF